MQTHWYGGLPKKKISGDRLVVVIDLTGRIDPFSVIDESTIRFDNIHEARKKAELLGYDDGIHIKVARGYGLKPRVDVLMKGKSNG